MWSSTEALQNGFNKVQPSMESSLDDLDDIEFSFHGVETRPKTDSTQWVYRRSEMARTLDVYSDGNRTCIAKLPIHKSESQPEIAKKENSMTNLTEKSTTSPYTTPRHGLTIRTVEITRVNRDPLGFFIRQGDGYIHKTGIYISRVTKGSLAESGGLLKVGDEILKINQIDIKGFCLTDVVQLIQEPTRLILTLRSPNVYPAGVRPKILSRHSSPSLLAGLEKDLKNNSHHSKTDSHIVTKDKELNLQQSDEFKDKSNANELVSSDLSKNNSAIDELIRLLRPQSQQQNPSKNDQTGSHKAEKRLPNPKSENTVDICNVNFKSSQNKSQTNQGFYEPKRASTITPSTTVDLIFDDDEETKPASMKPQLERPPMNKTHTYHRISVTQPQDISPEKPLNQQTPSKVNIETNDGALKVTNAPRSRSSSRGSSSGSSPKARRRLPSIPTEEEQRKRQSRKDNSTNMPSKPTSSVRTNVDGKPRRKLPTPPASPTLGYKHGQHSHRYTDKQRQKTLSWSGPEACSLTDIEELSSNTSEKDSNNNKCVPESPTSKPVIQDYVTGANKSKKHESLAKQTERDEKIIYRRSQSQHTDFFEQQRHSMFLQTFASGQTLINSASISGASASLSLSMDSSAIIETSKRGGKALAANSTAKAVTRESSPMMRRHASSSLLLKKSRDTPTQSGSIETEPGFSVFPDEYKNVDLLCSHAVSGMMKVRIIKAKSLTTIDKKKQKKISCAIEVDFERKALTAAKKATKNPSWDEIFDIEIQHGREMTFTCYGSKKEFDKPIARASFYLTPLVRKARAHQMIIRLSPDGLLFLELEFTEFKTLLKRAPSSKKAGVFGFNLSVTSEQEHCMVPLVVRKCVQEIEKRGLDSVGLYRISGNARKKEKLRTQFDENSHSTDISAENCPDINVITGILKDYLRELPEPLITEQMSQELILGVQDSIQDKDPIMKKKFLRKLLSELPGSNRNTLTFIMTHLCRVVNNEENKMDCRNLSVCLAPVLQCSPKNLAEPKDLLGLKTYLKAVEVLLDVWNDVEEMERDTRILHV